MEKKKKKEEKRKQNKKKKTEGNSYIFKWVIVGCLEPMTVKFENKFNQ